MKYELRDVPRLAPEQKLCSFQEAAAITNPDGRRANGHTFIMVPGVFDIIHPGHLNFFKGAGKYGLVIAGLEGDASVRANKGPGRPVNTIDERMLVVASLEWVNLVCELPGAPLYSDAASADLYVDRISTINPTFVAVPEGDPNINAKWHQAFAAGSFPVIIPGRHPNSTTQMLQKVGY